MASFSGNHFGRRSSPAAGRRNIPFVGSPWVITQMANRLGISKALGKTFQGQLALLQVIQRHSEKPPQLFLYDVTSSYLEGEDNALADCGYNLDGKKGKNQLVVGLLCDDEGEPVSTEVFAGNTQDIATFESQVKKTAERFGCKNVTLVGDKGMIKTGGIETLAAAGFHYITAQVGPDRRKVGPLNRGNYSGIVPQGAHSRQTCGPSAR